MLTYENPHLVEYILKIDLLTRFRKTKWKEPLANLFSSPISCGYHDLILVSHDTSRETYQGKNIKTDFI
jgi:hypothetical protein